MNKFLQFLEKIGKAAGGDIHKGLEVAKVLQPELGLLGPIGQEISAGIDVLAKLDSKLTPPTTPSS